MGTVRRAPGRRRRFKLWRLAILVGFVTIRPGATPPGRRGSGRDPDTHPCPQCDGLLKRKLISGMWVCENFPRRHRYTSRDLGLE